MAHPMILPMAQRLIDGLHKRARERATMFKAVSFGLIGVINSAVDFSVFSLGYYLLGFPIVAANVLSWATAVSCSYLLNSRITFSIDVRRAFSFRTYLVFVLAQTAGFAANTATVVVASYFMPVLLGKVLATGASFMVNFSLSHFLVFRRPTADA